MEASNRNLTAETEVEGITRDERNAAFLRTVPPAIDDLDLDLGDERVSRALFRAFNEGLRFAFGELVGQLIEAGMDVHLPDLADNDDQEANTP